MTQNYKHHRSSGHSTVKAAEMREDAVSSFKKWYFRETGDVMPDDMYAMLRRGFNLGWKAKKQYDRS